MTYTPTLPEHVDAAHGADFDALTVTDALDVADRLRAIADALAADAYTVALTEAAAHVEQRVGIT